MKYIFLALMVFNFTLGSKSAHALEPKTKAFVVMSAYGTVGGALLGFASMAFGASSRAIAQGASLGLYSGMIFGGYVLSTYNSDTYVPPEASPPSYYDDPYAPTSNEPQGLGAPLPPESNDGFFSNRVEEIRHNYHTKFEAKSSGPMIYLNLFKGSF